MKKIIITTFIATLITASGAVAQEAKSEKQAANALKFRQSIFQLVRSNMGPLGGMAKGQIPFNESTMETNGKRIEQLGLMIEDYFALDTTGFSLDTGAKNDIWKDREGFNKKAMDMVKAAQALQMIARNKDKASYRKAIGAVGATCKACHDDYKKD